MVKRGWLVIAATLGACGGGGADDGADLDASIDADPCAVRTSTASPAITQVEIARVDGDAFPDLLVHGDRNPGEKVLRFLRGRGDGTFTSPWSAVPVVDWWDFHVADVNGDARADVIFGAWARGGTAIGVLIGNGDGTFTTGFSVSGEYGAVAGVRSINGDAHADIVALVLEGTTWKLRPYLGDGAGGFTSSVDYTLTMATGPHHRAVLGDFDEDFDLDVAVAADNHIVVYFGNNSGTFQTTVSAAHPFSSPGLLAVADFDRTGSDDLLAVGDGSPQLQVLPGNVGGFRYQDHRPVAGVTYNAVVGDLERDDNLDLVSGVIDEGIRIAKGNGDATFQPARDVALPGLWPDALAIGDVDGDARNDLVYQLSPGDTINVILHDCMP